MKKLLILLFFAHTTHSTILVQGNASTLNATTAEPPIPNPNAALLTFSQPVNAEVFDHNTGTLYVALGNVTPSTAGSTVFPQTIGDAKNYAVSKVYRPTNSVAPRFIPIGYNTLLSSQGFDFLVLSTYPQNALPPVLALVRQSVANSGILTQNTIYFSSADGSVVQAYPNVLEAGTTYRSRQNGGISSGICGLAANGEFIFAAVKPGCLIVNALPDCSSTTFTAWGQPGSGIAVLSYSPTTLLPLQLSAQPGDPGVKAAQLNETSPQVTSPGAVTDWSDNRVSMYWDDPLQRLYIGLQLNTAYAVDNALPPSGTLSTGGNVDDEAKSIIVGSLSALPELGQLMLQSFLPDAALITGQQNNLVGVKQGVAGVPLPLAAEQVKVMHTTTGASYLILNGGNGTISNDEIVISSAGIISAILTVTGTVGNLIWALPLVDVGDPANTTQGLLANKNAFNATAHRFESPAVVNDDLTNTSDLFAMVGGGPIPAQPATPVSGAGGGIFNPATGIVAGLTSLDLVIVDDTVYVALSNAQTSTLDDTGVYYSQAMFDQEGKIIRWTPWSKRGLPYLAFPTLPAENSLARFIEVDPVTGKVWAIDGDFQQVVVTTGWDSGQYLSPLPKAVNTALANNVFSVLDLDQSTSGIGAETAERYALFGGCNAVAFTITTSTSVTTPPFDLTENDVPAPQFSITDFTTPQNLLLTKLPDGAGIVKVLEYSRQAQTTPPNTSNYFFAGTDKGLYVFADGAGNGFDSTQLRTLNLPPFQGRTWQLAPNIPGSIVDIKTLGNALYVISLQTPKSGAVSTLYRLNFQPDIATMFDPSNIFTLAQSATGNLSTTAAFYGMQLLAINTEGSQEQLILATNNGLYMSNLDFGVQAATSQTDAAWTLVSPDAVTKFYCGIAGIDTPVPTTAWPFSLQDPTKLGLYNRGSVFQINGGTTDPFSFITNPFSFIPVPFNANSNSPAFATFNPIKYFWSDGGRRFFDLLQGCNGVSNQLQVLPYDVHEWNVKSVSPLTDSIFSTISKIYWIKEIGATGLILAGTDQGIIALE